MKELRIQTSQKIEILDLTDEVERLIPEQRDGFVLVYCPHSTVALTVGENEADLMHDYARVVETLLAGSRPFQHCGHGVPNAEAHIFSALHGCSVIMPVENGRLKRGKFQSILMMEADGPRERQIWVYTL